MERLRNFIINLLSLSYFSGSYEKNSSLLTFKILNGLFEKNYKFFYFINNNLASESTSKLIKIEKGNTKCFYAFDHRLILENYKDFDAYLPIEEKKENEKIEWALKGCDAVITDLEYFDKELRDKYSFELHKI